MDLMNINDPCTTLTLAIGVSDQVAIPANCNFISVYNPSNEKVYVKTGEVSTLTCDATATFIPPNTNLSFLRDPKHTYLAGYSENRAVVLSIQNGGGI